MPGLDAVLASEAERALHGKPGGSWSGISLEEARNLFPIKNRRCYLNNASIGALAEPVMQATCTFLANVRDNGRNDYPHWCNYLETDLRGRVATFLGARPAEVAFVKNTTEGLVIVANGLDWREGDNVIVPDIDYPSNVYCWMKLAKRGVELRWAPSREGRIAIGDVAERMDGRTRVVATSAVQFSNGFRQDLEALGELCQRNGTLLSLDAIQWLGAVPIDLSALPVDFLSAGGHKWLLAPIGTGIFYCSSRALGQIDPPNVGYHSVGKGEDHMDYDLTYRPDAGRFEEALVNFPGLWGLDASLKLQLAVGSDAVWRQIRRLTDHALEGLKRKGYTILSPLGEHERSGILSFRPTGVSLEAVQARLAEAGVDLAVRGSGLRISPSFYNDDDEIDRFLEALPMNWSPGRSGDNKGGH